MCMAVSIMKKKPFRLLNSWIDAIQYKTTFNSVEMDSYKELIRKYNVAAPRYTSYPTVPFWDTEQWDKNQWIEKIKITHQESPEKGISLYIHLPFCESLCTYCGCNTRITKNHKVELPYLLNVVKEWELYKQHLGNNITIG